MMLCAYSSRKQSPGRGFTIVEVMVSLAIIAVLMSLLAPALGRSRESARRTACLVNLRTLGQAIQMYEDDHQGALPFAEHQYSLPIGWTDPIDALVTYLDGVEPPHLGEQGKVVTSQPFRCPSDPDYADERGVSYAYLPAEFMHVEPDDPKARLAKAKDITVHVFDQGRKMAPIFTDLGDWHPGGPIGNGPAPVHRNSLRFDGSVGWTAEDRFD